MLLMKSARTAMVLMPFRACPRAAIAFAVWSSTQDCDVSDSEPFIRGRELLSQSNGTRLRSPKPEADCGANAAKSWDKLPADRGTSRHRARPLWSEQRRAWV